MEIKGKIVLIGQTESVGTSGFTKKLLVLETIETYPQKLPIEFVKDKTALLDGKTIGQEATVSINLRGSEYNGKYYAQIQGWKIETVDNF